MIHPENKFLIYWDFLILIASLYITLILPVVIVFDLPEGLALEIVNWIITVIYIADIIINLNTAAVIKGKIVDDRKFIFRQYLKSWLILDILAAFPFNSLALFKHVSAINLSRLLRLIRLTRLIKLIRISDSFQKAGQSKFNPAIFRLFLLVFWIFIVAHLISCAWIYITPENTDMDLVYRYIRAFYWTITTLTTIGYGDITPQGSLQTIFVIFIELAGAAMYGLIIGNIANLIANIDIAKTQFKEKMKIINTFLKYRKIPLPMRDRINSYYNYLWESRRGYDESRILEDLPIPLKTSISLFLNKDIIAKVPLFEGASNELIKEVILSLSPVVFTPGDDIVTAGEVGNDMFFLSKGSVDVLSAQGQKFATLVEGQFFGEIALLLRMPRTATIRAREFCDLYRLDKETFDRILSRHPDFRQSIQQLAKERSQELEQLKNNGTKEDTRSAAARGAEPEAQQNAPTVSAEIVESNVHLTWEPIPGAMGYDIIRKQGVSEKWKVIAKQKQSTAYSDPLDKEASKLFYRVRALHRSGPGPWSDIVLLTLKS